MNTEVVSPLDKLTVDEKMKLVHTIWDDIFKHPEEINWPAWHSRYLRDLKKSIDEGHEEEIDFEEARELLLNEKL